MDSYSWTQRSVELANQKNYLDQLYRVYPLSTNERRELDKNTKEKLKKYLEDRNSKELINLLLDKVSKKGGNEETHPFPIKYSYVSYFKNDRTAIDRNPMTVKRIADYLYEMGLDSIIDKTSEPKETNRQMGQLFKNYISKPGSFGIEVVNSLRDFIKRKKDDLIFNGSDAEGESFAREYLNYNREKGLDFIARINGKYVVGEAKFLTDYGGHQNAQLSDAIGTLDSFAGNNKVIPIAILDGVVYISKERTKSKMFRTITEYKGKGVVLSALLLRAFIESL